MHLLELGLLVNTGQGWQLAKEQWLSMPVAMAGRYSTRNTTVTLSTRVAKILQDLKSN